jgi:trehalose 6-phosphate synthase/phosphatase
MPSERLLIVSNRLPVTARTREGQVQLGQSSGGLATGLGEYHARTDALWIGWPGDTSRLSAPQQEQLRALLDERRIVPVPLTAHQVKAFYEEFANGVIWPLFHYLLDRIPLDSRDWETYREVNAIFADRVAAHYRPGDAIWVHDYQLMLVPGMLRERLPDARIGFFLHIPFPSYEVFRTLPWRREILEGLVGADLVAFHTLSYARYFAYALRQVLSLDPEVDRVSVGTREVHIRAFPMGIDPARFEQLAGDPRVQAEVQAIREAADGRRLILGVDRMDYTKGIPRRLIVFDRLLQTTPEMRDRVRLIQVAVPSRVGVEPYQVFRKQIDELVGRINGAHGTPRSVPVHYMYRSIPAHQLVALYCAADVMLVNALRDGMNLVAKEFVASRTDDDGVLVLSEFAGAAEELTEAVLVNPYDINAVVDAIRRALAMSGEEKRARMRALRQRVKARSVHRWAAGFLQELMRSGGAAKGHEPPAPYTPLDEVLARVSPHQDLVLLLDYDGTLVPLASLPDLARADRDLIHLLRRVHAAGVAVHVVSGRSREDLTSWLGELEATLWAEHGAWQRPPGDGTWQPIVAIARGWIEQVRPILDQFAARTPGALVEEKSSALAWHYRTADPQFGAQQARELRLVLLEALQDQPLEILEGSKVIEVRWRGVHKGRVVERVLAAGARPEAMVAIGDDRTDEEMFEAMPPQGTSIHVGPGASVAPFRLADPAAVRALLEALAARPAPGAGVGAS